MASQNVQNVIPGDSATTGLVSPRVIDHELVYGHESTSGLLTRCAAEGIIVDETCRLGTPEALVSKPRRLVSAPRLTLRA